MISVPKFSWDFQWRKSMRVLTLYAMVKRIDKKYNDITHKQICSMNTLDVWNMCARVEEKEREREKGKGACKWNQHTRFLLESTSKLIGIAYTAYRFQRLNSGSWNGLNTFSRIFSFICLLEHFTQLLLPHFTEREKTPTNFQEAFNNKNMNLMIDWKLNYD